MLLLFVLEARANDGEFTVIEDIVVTGDELIPADLREWRNNDIAISIAATQALGGPIYYRLGRAFYPVPIGIGQAGEWIPVRGSRSLELYRKKDGNPDSVAVEAGDEGSRSGGVESISHETNPENFSHVGTISLLGNSRDYLVILSADKPADMLHNPLVIDLSLSQFPLGSAMLVNLTQLPLIFKFNDEVNQVSGRERWIIPVTESDSSSRVRRIDLRVGVSSVDSRQVIFSVDTPFITRTRMLRAFYIDHDRQIGSNLGSIELRDVGPVKRY